jgi:hypothetical protein
LGVSSFALGAALLSLASITYLSYLLPMAGEPLHRTGGTLLVPICVYVRTFAYAVLQRRLRVDKLLPFAVAGVPFLIYFGFYTGLLVSCSFGDCL